MSPSTSNPSPAAPLATNESPDARVLWSAQIDGEPEPALLSRLLQKLVCQRATLHTLHYQHPANHASARIEIQFAVDATRAQFLAKQWWTLIPVQQVILRSEANPRSDEQDSRRGFAES